MLERSWAAKAKAHGATTCIRGRVLYVPTSYTRRGTYIHQRITPHVDSHVRCVQPTVAVLCLLDVVVMSVHVYSFIKHVLDYSLSYCIYQSCHEINTSLIGMVVA